MATKNRERRRGKKGLCVSFFFLAALALLVAPFGQAFGLVIDNFEGDQSLSTDVVGNVSNSYSGPNIIGGSRIFDLHYLSGSLDLAAATAPGGSGFNVFAFSEDSGVSGTGEVVWSANTPYDLTDGGTQTSFLFRWFMNDHPLNVVFWVSDGTNTADYIFALDGNIPIENREVLFSHFAGVDMTSVTRIELRVPEGLVGIGNENDLSVGPIITQGIVLTCTKTFSATTVSPGDVITATVTVTAAGTGQATVNVTDFLDDGLKYEATGTVDPPTNVSADLRVLNWTGIVVQVGTPVTLTYNVLVAAIAPGQSLCNDVQVSVPGVGTILTECEDCVRRIIPPPPVPTFSEWGLMFLMVILAGTGIWFFRRRNTMS